jgi:hypothetical protein
LYSFINKMAFSLEHDIKVTKSHQNLLPTQSVIVVHTVFVAKPKASEASQDHQNTDLAPLLQ